jgi:hypothetical protein
VATGEGAGGALALVAALHGTAALAFALTGRVGGAWAARIGVLLVGTYL